MSEMTVATLRKIVGPKTRRVQTQVRKFGSLLTPNILSGRSGSYNGGIRSDQSDCQSLWMSGCQAAAVWGLSLSRN